MADDALVRAKQAVFPLLAEWFCPGCEHRKRTCCCADECKVPVKHKQAEDIARAVLQAAGYDELCEVLQNAYGAEKMICAACTQGRDKCDNCRYYLLDWQILAALQRAGKEA